MRRRRATSRRGGVSNGFQLATQPTMIRPCSTPSASGLPGNALRTSCASRRADGEDRQPDSKIEPAGAEEFAELALHHLDAVFEMLGDTAEARSFAPSLSALLPRQLDDDAKLLGAASFKRRADDELLGVIVEVALLEGRGIEGVEELVDGFDPDLDDARRGSGVPLHRQPPPNRAVHSATCASSILVKSCGGTLIGMPRGSASSTAGDSRRRRCFLRSTERFCSGMLSASRMLLRRRPE